MSKGIRKRYQAEGQDLVRHDIRVPEETWAILTEISHGLGYSRCFIFAKLLELELSGADVVVPTQPFAEPRRLYRWISIRSVDTYHGLFQRRLQRRPVWEWWEHL